MASLSYQMMTAANEVSGSFKNEGNYEAANDAYLVESLINNIHHGKYDLEWLPEFIEICNTHPSSNTEGFKAAYSAAIAIAKYDPDLS